jgi:endonuclease-3 related protein
MDTHGWTGQNLSQNVLRGRRACLSSKSTPKRGCIVAGRDNTSDKERADITDHAAFARILDTLRNAYGPQHGWWPQADGPIEVCAGAILVQHTTWASATLAIEALREASALDCRVLNTLPEERLQDLVRPAGTYRAKARTLHEFARVVVEDHAGSLEALLTGTAEEVRERLLRIHGIGPETADAITLYAACLPTFVVDAYALRILGRLAGTARSGDLVRNEAMRALGCDVPALQEAHALLVEHGRRTCLARAPRCGDCVLRERCVEGKRR